MTPCDKERYSRQIRFYGFGENGQQGLLEARAAIVGCGALGSAHAQILARAGVGSLILIDRDFVEINNLQRQWLYEEADAEQAMPKAAAAAAHIARVNHQVKVQPEIADLTAYNIDDLLADADIILDGTDNFETRYLMNEYAVSRGLPWIYGAAVGSYGLVMPILPGETACLQCVYPEPPRGVQPTCETAGVLNTVTAMVASLQANEALKLLAGRPEKVRRMITTIDLWDGPVREVAQPERDPECPVCSRREFPRLQGRQRTPISLCGRNAVQIHERTNPLDLLMLRQQLAPLGDIRVNEFALRFTLPPYEMTIFADGRAIVKGTTEPGIARSLYAKYVGN